MSKDFGSAASSTPRASVLAIAADLLFASRIRAVAAEAGVDAVLVRSPDALLASAQTHPPRRILIDLDARAFDPAELIRRLKEDERTRPIEVIAFVSHVREDAIAAARQAGADRVLARSAFVRQLPALMTSP
jgi:CheY-like chemotaxis protein